MPTVPEAFVEWRRSTKRAGGMFHLRDYIGGTACNTLRLERHESEPLTNVGQAQFWGLCPRCVAKAKKLEAADA
jgi:hypothetical protein